MPVGEHGETKKHRLLREHGGGGRRTQRGDSWEDIRREGRPELNSKSGQNELVEVGKVL